MLSLYYHKTGKKSSLVTSEVYSYNPVVIAYVDSETDVSKQPYTVLKRRPQNVLEQRIAIGRGDYGEYGIGSGT